MSSTSSSPALDTFGWILVHVPSGKIQAQVCGDWFGYGHELGIRSVMVSWQSKRSDIIEQAQGKQFL